MTKWSRYFAIIKEQIIIILKELLPSHSDQAKHLLFISSLQHHDNRIWHVKAIMGKQYCSSACLLDPWYLNSTSFPTEITFHLPYSSVLLSRECTRNEDQIVRIAYKMRMKDYQQNFLSTRQRLIWSKSNTRGNAKDIIALLQQII